MSWLRLDDKFAEHRKVLALTRSDRWTWLEILLYCSRHRSPHVPENLGDALKGARPAFLNRCYELGLLDLDPADEGGYIVHDWETYNPKDPTAADRMRAYRERNADRNEPRNTDRNSDRNETVTRAQPRARVPSPTPLQSYPRAVNEGEKEAVNQ